MAEAYGEQRLDFGQRSNDSDFGALDSASPSSLKPHGAAATGSGPVTESLSFRIAIVDSEADLLKVQSLRQAAYGHHLPAMAAKFAQPDPVDRMPDVTIFYAQDKATGRFVGSARIQTNLTNPLQIERSIELPSERRGCLLAEITRMTVIAGYPHPVKLALVKAIHLYCIALQITGIVAASRPTLLRQYLNLGFIDLYGDDRLVPMAHGAGLEHRVLFRDTVTSEADSRTRRHPDHAFVFRTYHPDLEIFNPVVQASSLIRSLLPYSKAA